MSKQSLELSIKANCMRILEILNFQSIEELKHPKFCDRKPEAIEIVQRGKQLRKDLIKLEKLIYK